MKKLFTTIAILMLAMAVSAQQIYIHETDEGTCRQNYHSLVTSDGCIIVDEDLFEGENGSTDLAKAQNNGLTITPDTLWFEPTPTGDIPEFVITNETANDVIIEDIIPEDNGFVIEGIDLSYTLPAGQSVTVTVVFMPAPGKNDYLDYDLLILTSIGEYHVTAMLNKTMIDYGLVIVGSPYQYVEDENGAGGCLQNRYFGSQIPVEIYSATEVGTDYLNIVPDWPLPYTLNPADWFTFMFYAKNPVKDRVITSVIVDSSDGQREFVVTISDELLSVTEIGNKSISLYPNPANDFVRIEGAEAAEVQIFNTLGQSVKTFYNTNNLSISDFPEGVYLLRITSTDGNTFTNRLVIR